MNKIYLLFIIPLALFFISIFLIIIMLIMYYLYYRTIKKIKPIKSLKKSYKEGTILKRLFYDFPKRFAIDRLTFNPNTFPEYGLHLICGMQGSGKTTTMCYLTRKYKTMYPKLRVVTNYGCPFQNEELKNPEQLTLNTNGIYGELDCISEIQNWFDSSQSKNFPPSFLSVITQQRKVRRCILADSQIFQRISKQLRENTYLLYMPFTLFGCITFVRVYLPLLDIDGNLKDKKLKKIFFFVHDEELRNMFDSYKVVNNLSKEGFKKVID